MILEGKAACLAIAVVAAQNVIPADWREVTGLAAFVALVFTIGWKQVAATGKVAEAVAANTIAQKSSTEALDRFYAGVVQHNATAAVTLEHFADRNWNATQRLMDEVRSMRSDVAMAASAAKEAAAAAATAATAATATANRQP